jgi:predicted HTH domain antitoxin
MSVVISDDVLQAAQITEAELKRELAILLFQQRKLGLSRARALAGMPLIEFQRELADRGINVQDDVAGFQAEVERLRVWGDL